ncbi:MAG: pseudouridine synthase [Acidobacteria bacterium]|nr:pseudouridine synthase [Acidobacteriota bacterium]
MKNSKKQSPDQPESDRPELDEPLNSALESDEATDAEAESAAAASDTFEQAEDDLASSGLEISEIVEEGDEPAPQPPAQLERLQKILAKSGIASRRHAEELITSGRVQINGKVVTELGSKADPARDHIRVDGKLLQGSERHRYFMLNKPKGYVTTVSDPEGRPTIMEFFSKTRERLYPVGRLDYLSEGLLLVTNDGELANKLTRAASGVEKTYLVKVSGQPSEEALARLREGVGIQKGKPGSGRVQTAPAEIRPFNPGKPAGKRGPSRPVDNPWYEVVLIEGRNRELRKMFEEIGHHVEKIRRVGYGPLVLDLEPGKTRELEPEEVENLRKAAEGKYRKPKPREPRKHEFTPRSNRPASRPAFNERRFEGGRPRDFGGRDERRPFRGDRPAFQKRSESGDLRRNERSQFGPAPDRDREPQRDFRSAPGRPNPRFGQDRSRTGPREDRGPKPEWNKKPERGTRPPRFDREARPGRAAPRSDRFQRPDRGSERGPSGQFPPRSSEAFRPKRFDRDRAGGPDRFPGKKRLEIRPADENFERPLSAAAPDRQSQRPFPPRTRSRPFDPNRAGGRRKPDQQSFDRPRRDDRGGNSRDNRPPRRESDSRPRFDRPRAEDRGNRRRDDSRPPRRDRTGEQGAQPRFDRPRRESSGGQRGETRSKRPDRSSDRRPSQRPSTSRPGGKFKGSFKGGKRGAPGSNQGATGSGIGRRPGSRPGGNSRPKRRP